MRASTQVTNGHSCQGNCAWNIEVYMCVCIYVYVYICIRIYTHTRVSTQVTNGHRGHYNPPELMKGEVGSFTDVNGIQSPKP